MFKLLSVITNFPGLADTFSYLSLGIINKVLMVQDDDENMFLWFFITLACFSFLSVIITRLVSSDGEVDKVEDKEEG